MAGGNPNHDERGRFASGARTAAKVVGGIALAGAAIAAGAIGAGAAHGVLRDSAIRHVARNMTRGAPGGSGPALARAATRLAGVPSTNSESARQGAMSVTKAMSASASRHVANLKVAIGNQHRPQNRFTGPKIRNK